MSSESISVVKVLGIAALGHSVLYLLLVLHFFLEGINFSA